MAGLSAAKKASSLGLKVAVLEKSRGIGGRAATRRIGDVPVDHGAQYFTVRSPLFQARVNDWLEAGLCCVWTHGIATWENGVLRAPEEGHPRYVCPGGMTSLAKHESQGLTLFRESTVSMCRRENNLWNLTSKEGGHWSAREIITTAPAPQTIALFDQWITREDTIRTLTYAPCLTGVFDVPGFSPAWKGLQVLNSDIAWMARDTTRREGVDSALVVIHGSPEFSRSQLEHDPLASARLLRSAATEIVGEAFASAKVVHAHRWRYARVENPLPGTHRTLAENLQFAGDAFLHANVESAWLSGRAAAEDLST
jgi:predicted NAD/FAD-dependent oxidoreductase